ncbi:hypothetical protein [Endozoicomonas sp. GU-1]|uniref:hypothetical protein n=1 Tax=Endozoicomonas sp. GU-1 TaxID=3009078 RepID=UPI0022B33E28|nr:hypothetical protein [Endozoicomonas sp. GU-1]WBA83090.1 hypothetical protein O2T12_08230 [Endozoicomonas sp. GU-1]
MDVVRVLTRAKSSSGPVSYCNGGGWRAVNRCCREIHWSPLSAASAGKPGWHGWCLPQLICDHA